MKAWRVSHHGGPEALERVDVAKPEPGPGEVRVRVEALGLNHLDVWVRKGVEGHKFPLPLIPGSDIAGVVDACGPGVERIKPGLAVVLAPGLSCGHCEACAAGEDPLCREYGILGETRDGGMAEFVVVPSANVIGRPQLLSAIEAASLPIPFLTAWTMLTRKARLCAGETALIHAGGSAVSTAAIQMAKFLGATVITTVGSAEKAARARELGADHVILYKKTPFREEVRVLTHKRGCDVVVDHVGLDTFEDSVRSLARGGRLVTCGATSGGDVKLNLKMVFFKNLSILGSTMGSRADFIHVLGLVGQGKLKPVIDSTFPMSEAPRAFERIESRAAFGKVVLTA